MYTDLDELRGIVASQPFAVLLGTEVVEAAEGRIVMRVPHRHDLTNRSGLVHGGVLAYLADNAITFACGTVLGDRVLTAGLTIDYLRPARGDLVATATASSPTARMAVGRCELTVDGEVVALAQASVRLRGQALERGQGQDQGAATPTGLG